MATLRVTKGNVSNLIRRGVISAHTASKVRAGATVSIQYQGNAVSSFRPQTITIDGKTTSFGSGFEPERQRREMTPNREQGVPSKVTTKTPTKQIYPKDLPKPPKTGRTAGQQYLGSGTTYQRTAWDTGPVPTVARSGGIAGQEARSETSIIDSPPTTFEQPKYPMPAKAGSAAERLGWYRDTFGESYGEKWGTDDPIQQPISQFASGSTVQYTQATNVPYGPTITTAGDVPGRLSGLREGITAKDIFSYQRSKGQVTEQAFIKGIGSGLPVTKKRIKERTLEKKEQAWNDVFGKGGKTVAKIDYAGEIAWKKVKAGGDYVLTAIEKQILPDTAAGTLQLVTAQGQLREYGQDTLMKKFFPKQQAFFSKFKESVFTKVKGFDPGKTGVTLEKSETGKAYKELLGASKPNPRQMLTAAMFWATLGTSSGYAGPSAKMLTDIGYSAYGLKKTGEAIKDPSVESVSEAIMAAAPLMLSKVYSDKGMKLSKSKAVVEEALIKKYGARSKEVRTFQAEYNRAFKELPRRAKPLKEWSPKYVEALQKEGASPAAMLGIKKVFAKYKPYVIGTTVIPPQTTLRKPPRGAGGDIDVQGLLTKGKEKAFAKEVNSVLKEFGIKSDIATSSFMGKPKYHVNIKGQEFLNIGTSKAYFQQTQVPAVLGWTEPAFLTWIPTKKGIRVSNIADQMRKKFEMGYLMGKPSEVIKRVELAKLYGKVPKSVWEQKAAKVGGRTKDLIDVAGIYKGTSKLVKGGKFTGEKIGVIELGKAKLEEFGLGKLGKKGTLGKMNYDKLASVTGLYPKISSGVGKYVAPFTISYKVPKQTKTPYLYTQPKYSKGKAPSYYGGKFNNVYNLVLYDKPYAKQQYGVSKYARSKVSYAKPSYAKSSYAQLTGAVYGGAIPKSTYYSGGFGQPPITTIKPPPEFDRKPFKEKKKDDNELKRLLKYKPSVVAVEKQIKGKRPKRLTGLGVRPILL